MQKLIRNEAKISAAFFSTAAFRGFKLTLSLWIQFSDDRLTQRANGQPDHHQSIPGMLGTADFMWSHVSLGWELIKEKKNKNKRWPSVNCSNLMSKWLRPNPAKWMKGLWKRRSASHGSPPAGRINWTKALKQTSRVAGGVPFRMWKYVWKNQTSGC